MRELYDQSQEVECASCLYKTDHPHGLVLNQHGVCSGCITHEEKFSLDWGRLEQTLLSRVRRYKGHGDYDCIIPIRGTPEYFKVIDLVRNKLGLNPLLTYYNSQFNSEVAIENIDLMREIFNVDIVHYTSNPLVYRKVIRETLTRFGSMRWPFLAGETQFPVQVAVEKKIPLIIWPYHQPTEQVGVHSYLHENEMTRRSRHEFELMGVEPHQLLGVGSHVSSVDISDLEYPGDQQLQNVGVRGLYLSNYYPWDSRSYSEEMIERFGARSAKNCRTFDTYDRIDDMTYMTVHDHLKFAKLGYTRVTDNLCREIRFKRISKEDAKEVEAYYQQHNTDEESQIFFDWLGLRSKGFEWLLEQTGGVSEIEAKNIELSEQQQLFVRGFQCGNRSVFENKHFIIFGKGLHV